MEFRIYYEDTDAGGIVYHANYLRYFERARTEYLRQRGVSVAKLAEQGCIFPVIKLEIEYRSPAFLDDLLKVETDVLEVGKTSFTLGQRVVRAADATLIAGGRVVLVCVGPAPKAKRLPADLLQALEQ